MVRFSGLATLLAAVYLLLAIRCSPRVDLPLPCCTVFCYDPFVKLTRKQRENLSKALYDVGKVILATVVLGRFVSDKPLDPVIILSGFVAVVLCFAIATVLDKGE